MLFDQFFTSYDRQETMFDEFLSQNGGKCRRIMDAPIDEHDEYLRSVAEMKRFLEVYTGKIEVRRRCGDVNEAQKVADELGLSINVNDFRVLWDASFLHDTEGALWMGSTELVWRYRCFIQEKLNHRAQLQQIECVPVNERFRVWRRRQMNRGYTERGIAAARGEIHAPLTFELSDGCSVGCWFCGVAAKKKGGDFLYTPENVRLWRSILEFFHGFLGRAAGTGVCYFATEPLDNPDYENWCEDFATVFGTHPQTTTAIATKDIERTRQLLSHSRSRGTKINRFSVLNSKMLDTIHAAFTPLELLYTELLTQNMESSSTYSRSGRAREHDEMFDKKSAITGTQEVQRPSTICCITGFRLNMVRKTIDLLSPCGADDQYPLGEYQWASEKFNDVKDVEQLVSHWTNQIVVAGLLPRHRVAFRRDVQAEINRETQTLKLKNWTGTYTYTNPLAPLTFDLIQQGQSSVYQIAEAVCEKNSSFVLEQVFAFLNEVFQDGFFNEMPEFFSDHVITPYHD